METTTATLETAQDARPRLTAALVASCFAKAAAQRAEYDLIEGENGAWLVEHIASRVYDLSRSYVVDARRGHANCSCKEWARRGACKHQAMVKNQIEADKAMIALHGAGEDTTSVAGPSCERCGYLLGRECGGQYHCDYCEKKAVDAFVSYDMGR